MRHLSKPVVRRVVRALLLGAVLALAVWVGLAWLRPLYHWHAARRAASEDRFTEARDHLAICLLTWPQDASVRSLAARTARRTGRLDEAEEHLLHWKRAAGYSDAILLEQAMVWAEAGTLDQVEDYLRGLVAQGHPETREVLRALTRGYLRLYRNPQALYSLKVWLERWPDDVEALLSQGQVWERLHNYREAVENFSRVVELEPGHDQARLSLANCLLEVSQFAEALPHLEYLGQRRPEDPAVQVRLACCRHLLGQSDEAARLLDELLATHPEYGPALTGRGQVALQTNQLADAEGWLRRAVAQEPFDYQANYLLHQCLKQCGKSEQAKEQQVRLERIKAMMQRLIEIANREMGKRPYDPALRSELGALLLQLGQEEVGMGWLRSALEVDPTFAAAHQALADYYGRKGDATQEAHHRQLASGRAQPVIK